MSKCEKCGYDDPQGTNDTAHFCGKFEKLTMEHHSPRLWTNSSATPPAEQVADSGEVLQVLTADERTALAKVKWSAENMTSIGQLTHGDIKALATLGDRLTATLAAQPAAEPNGTWLWSELMDWCKKRGVAPSNYDDLFAIAGKAHKFAQAQPAAGQVAIKWPNGCDRTIPNALRYLARNPRQQGGQEEYNAEHLLQLADEMDTARALLAATGSGK